jgi:hypothetical protein
VTPGSHQQSERSPTLGRRDAQTAAFVRDRRSEYRDQICRALALVEKPERIEPEPISDL